MNCRMSLELLGRNNFRRDFLTLYDPGIAFKAHSHHRNFALGHLILELHYCALRTILPKIRLHNASKKKFDWWSRFSRKGGTENLKLTRFS